MTADELYERAKSLMFEKPTSTDYDKYYIPWINTLLSENFDLNNNLRIRNGDDELEDVPVITSGEDEIPYERPMLQEILPYGLAANFFIDDDLSKFDIFYRYYQNAQIKYVSAHEEPVEDVYAQVD